MSHSLLDQFQQFIHTYDLITQDDHILIAVSGGVDSMVLFELFLQSRVKWNLQLSVLHLNHQLRGADSDADEQWVRDLCERHAIPLATERVDVNHYAQNSGQSLETAARECRYAFFEKTANQLNANKIATAHNVNDQAETLLDRICRGTGIRGLCGIPVHRDRYIRPLLFAERNEIERFAKQQNILYRTDHSNRDITFKRNKTRHVLLPLLQKEFNPGVITALANLAGHAAETTTYLDKEAENALKTCIVRREPDKIILDIKQFLTYLKSLQKIMLRYCLIELGYNPNLLNQRNLTSIEQFIVSKHSSGRLKISDISFYKTAKTLIVGHLDTTYHHMTLPAATGCFSLWNGYTLHISKVKDTPDWHHSNNLIEYIDADSFLAPVQVRSYKPSDRFYPVNGSGSKSISDFFIDEKVNRYERSFIPILECKTGIVWICGYRLDDRYKVTPSTTLYLKLELDIERKI
ncbi:MAG: tRNA lysidine(34) synthetase TilS [candidate division KSB1 bacterium]|nr:tRNA lysidine(34) synthetase TilS [candidate division KSB1 bacterium]